ncbi:hypothetical protein C0J52_05379 [Blattella germanica]|nr:hypothetical protein C0J52_05379 [Blattella germanica]
MMEYVTNDCKLPLIITNAQTVCHSSFNTCQRLLTLRNGQVLLMVTCTLTSWRTS